MAKRPTWKTLKDLSPAEIDEFIDVSLEDRLDIARKNFDLTYEFLKSACDVIKEKKIDDPDLALTLLSGLLVSEYCQSLAVVFHTLATHYPTKIGQKFYKEHMLSTIARLADKYPDHHLDEISKRIVKSI